MPIRFAGSCFLRRHIYLSSRTYLLLYQVCSECCFQTLRMYATAMFFTMYTVYRMYILRQHQSSAFSQGKKRYAHNLGSQRKHRIMCVLQRTTLHAFLVTTSFKENRYRFIDQPPPLLLAGSTPYRFLKISNPILATRQESFPPRRNPC